MRLPSRAANTRLRSVLVLRLVVAMIGDDLLMALIVQAIELKGTPYFFDACRAIIDAHDRAPLTRLERREERNARFVRLLHETNPNRTLMKGAA